MKQRALPAAALVISGMFATTGLAVANGEPQEYYMDWRDQDTLAVCPGDVTWHFKNKQTHGADAGELWIEFYPDEGDAFDVEALGPAKAKKNVQHFSLTTDAKHLAYAFTFTPGKLVLARWKCERV